MAVEWQELLAGRTDPGPDGLGLVMPLAQSTQGGSGSFQARCSDEQRWWVKPLNNCQHPRVVVNEFLVGRLGSLIASPVCHTDVVRVGAEHVGWEFRAGHHLEAGLACASRDVPGVVEGHQLDRRNKDDNQRRHVGIFALYDWCWGSDPQWLFEGPADERTHSHDHGHYFPGGPAWNGGELAAAGNQPHPLPQETDGLLPAAVEQVADRLETIAPEDIFGVLALVPMSWPVTNEELARLGIFLVLRAEGVAARVRTL